MTWLVAALVCVCASASIADEEEPRFLHDVRLSVPEGFDPSGPLVLVVYADDLDALRVELTGHSVREQLDDRLVVEMTARPLVPAIGNELDAYRAATFLVDYDTASVAALREEAAASLGEAPSVDALVGFVREKLQVSLGHGFEPASTTARHLEGDCSEHSILYAALARAFGYSARVVGGSVVVHSDRAGMRAYGHAWNEVHDGESWRIVDSTPLGDMRPLGYVPDYRAKNEGPGYRLELISRFSGGVRRLEVLGNTSSAGAEATVD